ncbi:DUF5694 domain-containing protein [Lacimicrobium sp. SS2-24]|uniref:DUF5694 domain-containing protein n=1 Tax=Lacimicrobium sp. SS2-24 TaxID=2005569 RepID=UPI0011321D78|nr:DUF5694 domain-containing protein [Lacimicrobium sp. SS2-24]
MISTPKLAVPRLILWLALLLGLSTSVFAESAAQPGTPTFHRTGAEPMFDFGGVQADMQSQPTRVLVLGTEHLNQMEEGSFEASHLSDVLDRLERFEPHFIAIEAINGRTCDEIQRYASLYPDVQNYCSDTSEALEALGMTRPEAAAAVEHTLDKWPSEPTASDRRHLAMLLFAAGETWSAVLQWSKLEESERIARDGVSETVAAHLSRGLNSKNENNLIGIEIARRLGLETLILMDDHSADYIYLKSPDSLLKTVQSVWKTEHPNQEKVKSELEQMLGSPKQMLKRYIYLNSKDYQRYAIENDFGLATSFPDDDGVARQYVAWWQVRGLRMVANVLEGSANYPGARVLVIVGATHKSYFDSYLDQMHDVELVSVKKVLRDE